jgi:cyclic-di-GMP-binding protein
MRPRRGRTQLTPSDGAHRRCLSVEELRKGRFAVPSFDIVSRVDLAEVDNALAGIAREIATRFDFKGSKCAIERRDDEIVLVADDDLKLKQMHELLKVHLIRRKVDPAALDYRKPEKASGNTLRQTIVIRQGIGADLARQLMRELKDAKLKVQAAVQGGEVRVSAKQRDDLQAAIAVLRRRAIEQPLQYLNFRE